jgi:hypothetical protein
VEQTGRGSIEILYCGGCNPQIDRTAIAGELSANTTPGPAAAVPATVHLSGCARACASGHHLVAEAAGVVVAGEMVDGVPTPAVDIAATIARKLEE